MSSPNEDDCTSEKSQTSTKSTKFILRPPAPSPIPVFMQPSGVSEGQALKRSEKKALAEAIRAETPRREDFVNECDDPVIFIYNGYIEAFQYSIHAADVLRTLTIPGLILFSDGSWIAKRGGVGITYKRTYDAETDWVDISYGLYNVKGGFQAETIALNRALWVAYHETMHRVGRDPPGEHQRLPRVVVLSDCIGAINYFYNAYHGRGPIAKPETSEEVREALAPLQKLMELGSRVEIRWVPAHVSV
ncbi:hypothetical protein F4818DRAFT_440346 [Hypoxylon cercidicola]|nr:hypothetical protein F4818DRAFT_440346 [Hypoxylon cercidicola]